MWAISYANKKVPYIRKLTYVFQQGFVSYQPVANLTMYALFEERVRVLGEHLVEINGAQDKCLEYELSSV